MGFSHLNWLPTRRAQKPSHEHVGVQLLLESGRTSSSGPICVAAVGESRVAATPSKWTSLTLRLREPGSAPLAPPNSSRQVNFLREVVPLGRSVLVGRKDREVHEKYHLIKTKRNPALASCVNYLKSQNRKHRVSTFLIKILLSLTQLWTVPLATILHVA